MRLAPTHAGTGRPAAGPWRRQQRAPSAHGGRVCARVTHQGGGAHILVHTGTDALQHSPGPNPQRPGPTGRGPGTCAAAERVGDADGAVRATPSRGSEVVFLVSLFHKFETFQDKKCKTKIIKTTACSERLLSALSSRTTARSEGTGTGVEQILQQDNGPQRGHGDRGGGQREAA